MGFLYISEKAKVQPLILGGGQQNGMRSGTDNVPGIAGLGAAAEEIYRNLEKNNENLYSLKEYIAKGLERIPDIRINGMPLREGAPQILSISVMGVRSEVLLHALEDRRSMSQPEAPAQATSGSPAPHCRLWECPETRSRARCV